MKKLVLLSMLLLCACGASKLDGTYVDNDDPKKELVRFTFKPNGKVVQSTMGVQVEFPYEVEGKTVKLITAPGTALLMTLQDDGSIDSQLVGKLKRKKS